MSSVSTTVIVKPDDLVAWTSLAGVVVGASLTTALDWWRNGRGGTKRRRRQLIVAGMELERRARALANATEFSKVAVAAGESPLAWIKFNTERTDALYELAGTIISLGSRELSYAAHAVIEESQKLGADPADDAARRHLVVAIKLFRLALDKVKP
jgi:hypothetical protein